MMSTVSIIVPLFNRPELIVDTILSVQNQSFSDWEFIVVDDGSTDTSLEVVSTWTEKDTRIKIFSRPENLSKGPSSCRNFGSKKAKGKYLIFLDSDDLLASFCLDERVRFMERHSNMDLAIFNIQYFKNLPLDSTEIFNVHTGGNRKSYVLNFLSETPGWQTMAPIWKRDTFYRLGGFNETLTCMEDPELHLRALLDNSINIAFCEDTPPDCYYRKSDFSKPGASERFYDNSIRGRFLFYPMMWERIKHMPSEYRNALKKGLIRFFKYFLLARIIKFEQETEELFHWIQSEKILNPYIRNSLQLTTKCWNKNHPFYFKLPVKRILFDLL